MSRIETKRKKNKSQEISRNVKEVLFKNFDKRQGRDANAVCNKKKKMQTLKILKQVIFKVFLFLKGRCNCNVRWRSMMPADAALNSTAKYAVTICV